MPEVPFTKFIFPNGERREDGIDRPEPIYRKAMTLLMMGFRFEVENQFGSIWMTCIRRDQETVDRWCKNGPDVPKMVDELIEEAFARFEMEVLK